MKKVKTLLVTAVAALSMTACSLEDVKAFPGQAGAKISEVFNSLLEKVGLRKKEEKKACEHQDKNHDGVCDLCGATGLEVKHADENHDHKCDECGIVLSQHADEDNDFVCDICGEALEIASVRLDDSDVQKLFSKGDEFSADGLKVIATSEVGSEKELEFTTSQPDMSTVGDKTVTVTYGEGENDKFEYTINVSYWSDADLALFDRVSFTGDAPLPYLPGFNMRTISTEGQDGKIESWSIVADKITDEGYLDYYNLLKEYKHVIKDSDGDDITFELTEIAGSFDGYHGLVEVSLFALVPWYLNSRNEPSRVYANDEYIIVGINENDQLVVENRFLNAMLDGYFFGNEFADGTYYFPAAYQSYIKYVQDPLYYYFSEYSESKFVIPPQMNADVTVMPVSLFSLYPLDESYDVYDLAWAVELDNATAEERDAFIAALGEAGYETIEHPETETTYAYTSYEFSNEFAGTMEYRVRFYPATSTDESALIFNFYYKAPATYTTHLTPVAKSTCQLLGDGAEITLQDSYALFSTYGCSVGLFDATPEEGETAYDIAVNFGRTLVEAGYVLIDEVELEEDEQYGDSWYFEVADKDATLDIYVTKDAKQNGKFAVEVQVYDTRKAPSVSKVEAEMQNLNKNAYGFKGLRGVDYTIEEDDEGEISGSAEVKFNAEETAAFAGNLEGALMAVAGECLPDTYELVSESSEATQDGWTATFNDIDRGFQAVFTAEVEDELIVVKLEVRSVAFVTPESVMIEFLTAQTGSAPEEGAYLIDDEDKSVLAELTIEDAEASAEGLEAVATALAEKFGESFVAGTPQAGEQANTVVLDLANETSGIDAEIVVGLGESGYVATVYIEFHVEPQEEPVTAASVAAAFNEAIAAINPNIGLTYNSTYELWVLNLSCGQDTDDSAQNLYSWATTFGSMLPDTMSYYTYQYKAAVEDDPETEEDETADAEMCVIYVSDDFSVVCKIYSWIENGVAKVQILLYDVE